jgi:5-formyltetrahydrofolate cyclo-ligase
MGSAERQVREAALVQSIALYIRQHHANAVVAMFMPHAGEPSLLGLLSQIRNPLCLPVVVSKAEPLQFAPWDRGEALEKDRYGILTPMTSARISPQILLIPCVGYTAARFRLGYGGGYYDRTLAALARENHGVTAIGVAWSQAGCVFPPNEYDIAMHSMQLA